jgi:signal transduction histidine kinase/CheY-like chemotaxis protein
MPVFESCLKGTGENANSEELTLTRSDGTTARVELRVASETVSGARIIVMTDISYRLVAEREREELLKSERAARADAERSNRLKEEFLATISHELRNPLNAILGWATLLDRTEDLAPDVKRAVQAIERNSRIQAQMIADLLDYAAITFGKVRLQRSTINPFAIVRAALEVVATSAQARHIHLRTAFTEDELSVDGDPARLQQVVMNLLSNAIKFSPEGGTVEVIATRVNGDFGLTVRDYGKGISPAFLPHIFERFSQQDSSSTKSYGGLGLGLAIVKQLVDLHGGTIEVTSTGEGQGAIFTVRLPLSEKSSLPTEEDAQSLHSLNLSGVVALVVEDDSDARELIRRLLTAAGAQVIEAHDAASALNCIRGAGANFLISDIGMAGKDGYNLMRSLRAQGYGEQELPAIALTAFARPQDRAEALAAGFQDHLIKPLDAPTLIARVGSLRRSKPRPLN